MNIEEIVQNSRCRSCGYCFSVCPVNAIEMVYHRKLYGIERKAAQARLYLLQPDGHRSGHQAGGLLL